MDSVETQTKIQTASVSVGTQIEIRTAHVEVQTTPVSVGPQTTLVSVETQTIEVRDEMEDRRQRDKEKQVSPIYPWDMHLQPLSSIWRPLAFLPVTLSVLTNHRTLCSNHCSLEGSSVSCLCLYTPQKYAMCEPGNPSLLAKAVFSTCEKLVVLD